MRADENAPRIRYSEDPHCKPTRKRDRQHPGQCQQQVERRTDLGRRGGALFRGRLLALGVLVLAALRLALGRGAALGRLLFGLFVLLDDVEQRIEV